MVPEKKIGLLFSNELNWLKSPSNNGLHSIVAIALLIWRAHEQKFTGPEIRHALLDGNTDKLFHGRFWRGNQLFQFWKRHNLPDEIKNALNSPETARAASLNWLATKKGITRQEDISRLREALDDVYRPADFNKIEEISKSIANAVSITYKGESTFSARDFAVGIVNALSAPDAEEFEAAVVEAFSSRFSNDIA